MLISNAVHGFTGLKCCYELQWNHSPEGKGMEYCRQLFGSVALADFVGSIYAIPMLACLVL